MAKQYPCILTLDPSVGIITNASDMVAYTIRQFFGTPGRISDIFKSGELISFRELKSVYNNQVTSLCNAVQSSLLSVLQRLIPADDISVECELVNKYSDTRYDLQISVIVSSTINGVVIKAPVLTQADISVENDQFVVKLKGDSLRYVAE